MGQFPDWMATTSVAIWTGGSDLVIISLSRWPVSVFISKTGEKSVGSKFGNFRVFSIERRDWLTRTGPPVETAPRIYVE
jgi:hypothetical protein